MRCYIVLGTGRSATSFISESLSTSGVEMWKKCNEHAEDDDFKTLNKRILKAAGGDAYNIPSHEAIMAVEDRFEDDIKATIEKHRGEMWGWKDPRTVFTLDLYLPHIKDEIFLIYSIREWSGVRKSLQRLGWGKGKDIDSVLKEYKKRLIQIITDFSER